MAGDSSATVSWAVPQNQGGTPVTSYTVKSIPEGHTATVSADSTTAAVASLTNGTTYRFTVTATNASGTSAASASSDPVTPAAPKVPDAPFITDVTARDSALEVAWSPPASGTAGLTGYTLTASPGGKTVTAPASSTETTVTGLTNGTPYTFTITAANANGTSAPSSASTPVSPRPAEAPSAPANVVAVPRNGQLQLSWVAGPDGGSAITGYTVTVTPGPVTVTTDGGTTVATVGGLNNGTAYTASVVAENAAGTSEAGTAAPVTPAASIAPRPPTNLSATATAAGTVALQWTPPTDPGTSPITGYTVTSSPGATTVSSNACSGTPTVCTASLAGLTKTTKYTFTATATSSAGTSAAGAPTDAVTPNVVVKKSPVILSSASLATLLHIQTDGTLLFEQPPAQVTGLKTGDLVLVDPGAVAPTGFLGRVKSVTNQAGFVVVTTTQAALSDVFSSYDVTMDMPVNADGAQLVGAAPGVRLGVPTSHGRPLAGGRTVTPHASPVTWTNGALVLKVEKDLAEGESPQGGDDVVKMGPVGKITGTVTVKPILKAHVSGTSLAFTMGGKITGKLSGEFGVHLGVEKSVYLGSIPGPTVRVSVPTPAGAVPVPSKVMFPIYATFNSDGSVGVSFEASYDHTLSAQCTVSLSGGSSSCDGVHQGNGQQGGLQYSGTAYGKMEVSTGIKIGVTLQIAYIAGPQVTLTPNLKFTAETNANPWWDLFAEGHIGVSVTVGAAWGKPETVFEAGDLLNQKLFDLKNSGGPWQGLVLTPSVVHGSAGTPFTFTASTPAGQVSSSSVTWKVLSGPGSVDANGRYVSPQDGIAVVEAEYNGLKARAGVVIGDVLDSFQLDSDTGGVVLGAVAGWAGSSGGDASSYQVTVQPTDTTRVPAGQTAGKTINVPEPASHAYVPDLIAGVPYALTVYAVGAHGAQEAASAEVTPLDPLPSVLAGTNFHGDIAINSVTGKPDSTGVAGYGGAALSANGLYAFFYTEARSNLAPPAIRDPYSDLAYLVRENLVTGQIEAASIDPSGAPVPAVYEFVNNGEENTLQTDASGNLVAFAGYADGAYVEYVHDMANNTTWAVKGFTPYGTGYGVPFGLTNSGAIAYTLSGTGYLLHSYVETQSGAPKQVDTCTDTTDHYCGRNVTMAGGANLIAYDGAGAEHGVNIYDIGTGATSKMNPPAGSFDEISSPKLSVDGSKIAVDFHHTDADGECLNNGIAVTSPSTPPSAAQIVTMPDCPETIDYRPLAISDNGTAAFVGQESSGDDWFELAGAAGDKLAPAVGETSPGTIDISYDGSRVLYTLAMYSRATAAYPGVYEWQP